LNLINPIELYAFANETNLPLTKVYKSIEITKIIFTLQSQIGVKFFSYLKKKTCKAFSIYILVLSVYFTVVCDIAMLILKSRF